MKRVEKKRLKEAVFSGFGVHVTLVLRVPTLFMFSFMYTLVSRSVCSGNFRVPGHNCPDLKRYTPGSEFKTDTKYYQILTSVVYTFLYLGL